MIPENLLAEWSRLLFESLADAGRSGITATPAPGSIFFAAAGESLNELGEVQPQGKKRMLAADWARGARIASGERLGL